MKIRKIYRWSFKTTLVLFSSVVIYFLAAVLLSFIPVNKDFIQSKSGGVDIYILTNGVHASIALPIKSQYKDWSKNLNPAEAKTPKNDVNFISFGWGDKGFYQESYSWKDLKFTTAFNALFNRSSSAMQVKFYNNIKENKKCKKISISHESHQKLIKYIEKGFDTDSLGNYIKIPGLSYTDNDVFYEAEGMYNLFNTCNTWANNGLKAASLKACLWTPFDKGVFYQYAYE